MKDSTCLGARLQERRERHRELTAEWWRDLDAMGAPAE